MTQAQASDPLAEPGTGQPPDADLEALRRRNAELELLYDTIRDLSSTLSVREVLERLLARSLAHLNAEIGSILLVGPDERLRIVVAQGLPVEVVDRTCLAPGEGISGIVVESDKSLLVTDVEQDARFKRRNHERYYTHSFISAPLRHMGAARGVINVNNKRSQEPFVADDLRLLEAIAGHASAALANAHQYERILDRAQRDSLTGLANHGHLWSNLEIEFRRSARHCRPLGLVMVDVDHFKAFNDRFGHPAGDQALRTIARELEQRSRAHDLVARYGGEEFAIVLPETPLEGAVAFAEKIRQSIEAVRFGDDTDQVLTVSVGAAATGTEASTPQQLVELADRRLYRAKAAGRNRVCSSDHD